jgi:hypothetical protein
MNRTQWQEKAAVVTAEIDNATMQLAALLDELNGMIEGLPDNPKINRINDQCFTLRFKDLNTSNWSPEYYDFKRQYRKVIEALKSVATIHALEEFRKIVGQGWIHDLSMPMRRFKFHPDVLANLKSLLS